MNKLKELEKKIEELSNELEDLKCELLKMKSNNYERWRADSGEIYYCVSNDGKVDWNTDERGNSSTARYDLGNYFQTKQEAEKVAEKIKIYVQLKDLALRLNNGKEIDWENSDQPKHYIRFDDESNKLCYSYCYTCPDIGQIYCLDSNFLNIAKQEIGEENLKKLFEG